MLNGFDLGNKIALEEDCGDIVCTGFGFQRREKKGNKKRNEKKREKKENKSLN